MKIWKTRWGAMVEFEVKNKGKAFYMMTDGRRHKIKQDGVAWHATKNEAIAHLIRIQQQEIVRHRIEIVDCEAKIDKLRNRVEHNL